MRTPRAPRGSCSPEARAQDPANRFGEDIDATLEEERQLGGGSSFSTVWGPPARAGMQGKSPSSSPRSVGTEIAVLSAPATAGPADARAPDAKGAPSEQPATHGGDLSAAFAMEQQLQAERSRAVQLERENEQLAARLLQLQQEHRRLEQRLESTTQVVDMQGQELSEKSQLVELLHNRLARLSNLMAAASDEVGCALDAAAALPYPPAFEAPGKQNLLQHTAAAAGYARPAPAPAYRPDGAAPEQARHQSGLRSGAQPPAVAAAPAGGRLPLRPMQPAAGDAAAAARGLPAGGSKRSRMCSATGSAGEAAAAGGGAGALKHAASGGSGSSSSRQQISGDEQAAEEGDEADCGGPAIGCSSAKRQRSGTSSQHEVAPGHEGEGGDEAAEDDAMRADEEPLEDDDGEEDKSQDDLDAAQCLQQLAMSAGGAPSGGARGERFAGDGAGSAHPLAGGRVGAQPRWLGGGSWAAGPASVRVTATGSFGSSLLHPPMVSSYHIHASEAGEGAGGEGYDLRHLRHAQQQQLPQQRKLSMGSFHLPPPPQQQQQQQQLPQSAKPMGGPQYSSRRPDAQAGGGAGSPWGLRTGSGSAGSMAAPVRARKQSWFQTEIAEKIPLSVQQACAQDWSARQCMQVVCADLCGTFYVNSAGEYLVKLASSGEVVTPNKFEELAGKKTARNWQQSIRLMGYTMNGEPNSALLKLGHFTRIVGLVQDR